MILVNNITCKRGPRIIFKDLSFKIENGIATIISGKNGSGKTSLLRILANLLNPRSGNLIWKGKSVYNNLDNYYKELTYVADTNCAKEKLSIIENMNFWKNLYHSSITKNNIIGLLENLSLIEYINKPVHSLSSGQKRKLELTRLIIEQRNIWVMDEPFSGLDQDSINIMGQTISDHLSRNGTAVLSSHVPVSISSKKYIDLDLHATN